ncbi:2-dehydro-3-deoxygalactonokinase [Chakrabartyella piscis]|uniref:2-dehydro-3-deoxygalactonokinase n=1 Tax=Chakrabartyella piscis TaxID=2918914 RepID=UPI0029586F04|nr:2-dehydro-3-deoxygalactonokinase [Chakrabartyella piscis]
MNYYVAIDSGTTNTRVRLLNDTGVVLDTYKSAVGVKDTAIDGNNKRLQQAVRMGIEEILANNAIMKSDIKQIFASGMITSDMGLYELDHLVAPVGLKDLKNGVKQVMLEDVIDIPISFIPGIKNKVDDISLDTVEEIDIMRGEEVEAIAVLSQLPRNQAYVLILPGSHTKLVKVDENGKITGCATTMAGELLSCITKNTIISSAVNQNFVDFVDYDRELVLLGYETAKKVGLSRSIFSARIINRFIDESAMKSANYILGAVLQSDIVAIQNSCALQIDQKTVVVVSGKEPLKSAFMDILQYEGCFDQVQQLEFVEEEHLSAIGAFLIMEGE